MVVAVLNRHYFVRHVWYVDRFDQNIVQYAIDVWLDLIIIVHGLEIVLVSNKQHLFYLHNPIQ